MDIKIKINPAYMPYLNKPQFTQILFGGSSSGKSYFLSQKIVLDNINGVNWLCCRNVAKTIRSSTFNEICKAITRMDLKQYYKINQSDMVITCLLNNAQILFAGLDDAEKVKSITPVKGVLERVFVEEATEIKYEAYKQLTKRLRGNTAHSKHIILAFNPILKSHWIYQEFFGKWQDDKNVYEDEQLLILKTTYKDNMFLTDSDIYNLENEKDEYYRNVYTYGFWGVLGEVIFKNWRVENLSERIKHFDKVYIGCDFGYSNDPNAVIKINVDEKHKRIYVFDEVYQTQMTDEDLANVLKTFAGTQYVTCDSAEPKTIEYLISKGIRALSTSKGKDSINRGIRWLQGYEIIIDVNCQNFKNEIEKYQWQKDKNGIALAKPVDKDNHLIDALRYAVNGLIRGANYSFD